MGHGQALRAAREAQGISLQRMAELTHYSKATIGHIETGRRTASAAHVAAYEEALGTRIDLLGRGADAADVDLLRQAADLVTSIGLRHGGMHSVVLAEAQWDWARGLLGRKMPESVRGAMAAQAARVADRLAWSFADTGRGDKAVRTYKTALDLADSDPTTRAVVAVDLANHWTSTGAYKQSLELLDSLDRLPPVLEFSANAAKARSYALLGDWGQTIRHVGIADEAHASVEPETLPDTHRPYLSGRAAHPHRDAGKAFHALALAGHAKAVPMAVERLEEAIRLFGPDRARAVGKCEERLVSLVG